MRSDRSVAWRARFAADAILAIMRLFECATPLVAGGEITGKLADVKWDFPSGAQNHDE